MTTSKHILRIDNKHKIIFDDFRNVKLDDEADLIFADPPFGIGFKGNLQTYNRTPDSLSYVDVPKEKYSEFIRDLAEWSYSNLKNSGSMWLLSGWNNLRLVLDAVEDVGFKQINHCIWKYQFGVFTRRRFTTSHYHLLLLVKDERNYVFNKPEHYSEDVWYIKRPYHHGEKTAGNELPEELIERCIRTSSNEGDLVVDPCLGSGTTMKVSMQTGRRCIGIEINTALEERIKTKLGPLSCQGYRVVS
ncbi:site-specific DNA-methyltransferase [Candidatus Bathyarchaeota archaeon]|nr:site-specific DNA-methyltransferase [Candidatus Bathyarchaeota archaeon]MBS7629376.1 site-specific DNA-methyltransferase [Candidatus Bathyarchaeota archaeon]